MDNFGEELKSWLLSSACFIAIFFFGLGLAVAAAAIGAAAIGAAELFKAGGL